MKNRIPHGNRICFLVQPLEHGMGGCHGDKVLTKGKLTHLLKINPTDKFKPEYGCPPRICLTPDMNDCIFEWNGDVKNWEKVD